MGAVVHHPFTHTEKLFGVVEPDTGHIVEDGLLNLAIDGVARLGIDQGACFGQFGVHFLVAVAAQVKRTVTADIGLQEAFRVIVVEQVTARDDKEIVISCAHNRFQGVIGGNAHFRTDANIGQHLLDRHGGGWQIGTDRIGPDVEEQFTLGKAGFGQQCFRGLWIVGIRRQIRVDPYFVGGKGTSRRRTNPFQDGIDQRLFIKRMEHSAAH